MDGELAEDALSLWRQRKQYLATIFRVAAPLDKPLLFEAVDEFYGRVVNDLKARGNLADRRRSVRWHTFNGE